MFTAGYVAERREDMVSAYDRSLPRKNPWSARASRAGDGALDIANLCLPRPLRRGAAMSTRGRVRSPENNGASAMITPVSSRRAR